MTEQFVTYFGYGSLVNRNTRPAEEQAHPARLYGWRRVWGHRVHATDEVLTDSRGSCCSLSVEKCPEPPDLSDLQSADLCTDNAQTAYIDGVIVTIPLTELPALDRREDGYDRIQLPVSDFDVPGTCAAESIHMYVSDVTHSGRSNTQYPILQSYIDCVLAGYCAVFDHSGMEHFIASTQGWDGVIDNERDNPRYPRAVPLPESQLALFDSIVNRHRST